MRRALLSLVPVLLLGACGDDDGTGPDDIAAGRFEARITGSFDRSFEGIAVFGTDTFLGSNPFGLSMEDETGTNSIAIVKATPGRPGTGTHTVGDLDSGMYVEIIVHQGDDIEFFISESGELRITSSSSQGLVGELTFTAENEFGAGQLSGTVTFHAICFATPGLSCD